MGEKERLDGSRAFFWRGTSREAVLCLHGFTGSPGIYLKLAHKLKEEHLTVFAPRLPGHGTMPEALAKVTHEQFIQASEEAFAILAEEFERVHIIGLSLGGALATVLAANHAGDRVLGSVSLLSPGYAFNPGLAAKLGLDSGADPSQREGKMIPLPARPVKNDDMDECIFAYNMVPLVCYDRLHAFNALARDARATVTAPVMLLYAEHDMVVDSAASAEAPTIFPQLEEFQSYEKSEHNLLLGCDREEIVYRCTDFISRHRI